MQQSADKISNESCRTRACATYIILRRSDYIDSNLGSPPASSPGPHHHTSAGILDHLYAPQTMDSSPLSLLPPELRSNIYGLVLRQSTEVRLAFCVDDDGDDHLQPLDDAWKASVIAIRYTCKQINSEARAEFYKWNDFVIHTPG